MKQLFYIAAAVLAIVFMSAWKEVPQKVSYEDEEFRCEYDTANGMRNGRYASWYKNGTKRAEGSFRHNMRCGLWTVYDSTGRKRMTRKYKNNFEFELIFPKPSGEGPIPLLSEPKYTLTYSEKGYIPYCYLEERAVAVSKRIWAYIPAKADHPLFANMNFYHALMDSLAAGKIKGYDGSTDDEFRVEISEEMKLRLLDTSKYKIVGYRLKEDWFFDRDRMISETRTIGLMPVCRSKTNEADQVATVWFYFPYLRPLLAQQKITGENIPSYIHTLDDAFFFCYIRGSIYRETNYYDRGVMRSVDDPAQGLRRTTSLTELEHTVWISFSE